MLQNLISTALDLLLFAQIVAIFAVIMYVILAAAKNRSPRWDMILFIGAILLVSLPLFQWYPRQVIMRTRLGLQDARPEAVQLRTELQNWLPDMDWSENPAPPPANDQPAQTSNPGPALATPTAQPSPQPTASAIRHTVSDGDTLASIAARYGLTVAELSAANGSLGSVLPGQSLIIPTHALAGGGSPASQPSGILPTVTPQPTPSPLPTVTVMPPPADPSPAAPCIVILDNGASFPCPPTPQVHNGGS